MGIIASSQQSADESLILDSENQILDLDSVEEDYRVPLDGTDRARLVSMRLYRHRHPTKTGEQGAFFMILHSLQSPLRHERIALLRALSYWFKEGVDRDTFTATWVESMEQRTWRRLTSLMSRPECLDEMERTWISGNSQAAKKGWYDSSEGLYWLQEDDYVSEQDTTDHAAHFRAIIEGAADAREELFAHMVGLNPVPVWEVDPESKFSEKDLKEGKVPGEADSRKRKKRRKDNPADSPGRTAAAGH